MARSMWKKTLAAALLSAGIGTGYSWMCHAQAPSTAQDTVEVSIEGKATTCQFVHSWRDASGRALHIVFNQANGEMLTLVPEGNSGEVRIIHWGLGAQSPPANTPQPHEWKFEAEPLPKISESLPVGYAPKGMNPPSPIQTRGMTPTPPPVAAKHPAPTIVHGAPSPTRPTPVALEGQAASTAHPQTTRTTVPQPQGLEVSLVRTPPAYASHLSPRSAVLPSTMARYTLPDVPPTSSLEIPGVPIVGPSNPENFPPPSAYGPITYRTAAAPAVSGTQDPAIVLSQAAAQPAAPPGASPLPDVKAAPLPDVPVPPPMKMPANGTPSNTDAASTVCEICPPVVCDPCVAAPSAPKSRWFGGMFQSSAPVKHGVVSSCEVICCPDVVCQDACMPPPGATGPGMTTPKPGELVPLPKDAPKKDSSAKIPGTNQPWPVGVQSAVAAYGGMHGRVSFLPVPIATIPEPRRIPQPPNIVPQPPQPTRPDPMAVNAFSPTAAEMAAAPMPGYGYGPMPPYAMPPMAMNPYGMMPANPYAMMGAAPMMTTAGMVAPGYPMMPQAYPMNPYAVPAMPMAMPMNPYAVNPYGVNPYAVPAMPSPPMNVAPTVQPASYSASAYNNAMDRRIPVAQASYGPAHAKHLNHYLQVLTESSSPGEREWAANSLAGFDPHAFPQVVSALTHAASRDANSGVRAACINNLSRMTLSHEHAARLIGAFRHETDPRVKQEVDRALSRLGVTQASK